MRQLPQEWTHFIILLSVLSQFLRLCNFSLFDIPSNSAELSPSPCAISQCPHLFIKLRLPLLSAQLSCVLGRQHRGRAPALRGLPVTEPFLSTGALPSTWRPQLLASSQQFCGVDTIISIFQIREPAQKCRRGCEPRPGLVVAPGILEPRSLASR